jgi:undecaprenyl pyrophosphate synthase
VVAQRVRLEILKYLWRSAKEELTTGEIKNKLLLTTNEEERTVFYMAAYQGRLEILQKVWDLAKEKITTEINNKLLLATRD